MISCLFAGQDAGIQFGRICAAAKQITGGGW